jgi:diguanylate cyclase (GGDEF)-like protein
MFIAVFLFDLFVAKYVSAVLHVENLRVFRALVAAVLVATLVYLYSRVSLLKRDALTGLYRRLIAEEQIEEASRARKDITIAIVDVNGLGKVNNASGHDCGDKLLREVASRLSGQFGMKSLKRHGRVTIARLGGDEFVVLAQRQSPGWLSDQLTECLGQPHSFGDWHIASAGVARSRNGNVRDAFKCADLAMYRAKKTLARKALQYDCVLDGIPPSNLSARPAKRLRD